MHDPDPDLIRAWQRGEPAAFAALVRLFEGPVGRFLVRLTGCPHAAGDLLQETFLRVHLHRRRYADRGRFADWVYRIALNQARDAARRYPPPGPLPDSDPPAAAADDPAERAEAAALVAAALDGLQAPLREVVVLRHYEGMNFEDMARLLDTPATTLKSRFAVALGKLREKLTARGLAPEDAS